MVTIKDVAREAGVSIGTVSNVLNNGKAVSLKNRNRVEAAIEKLNYSPNQIARMLKNKSSKNIGLIIPNINNPYYPHVAKGVEDAAARAGYTVFLCNSGRSTSKEEAYVSDLLDKQVDGLILIKTALSAKKAEELCRQAKVVFVDCVNMELVQNCGRIQINNIQGACKAYQALYDFGHRKIAFLAGHTRSKSGEQRLEEFEKFFAQKELCLNSGWIRRGTFLWHSGYKLTKEIMSGDERPTAIIGGNDIVAMGVIKALGELGLKVPGDVSVMGFDDIEMSVLFTPPLASVTQPKYYMGSKAVSMLMDLIAGGQGEEIVLQTDYIQRESVGPVKTDA